MDSQDTKREAEEKLEKKDSKPIIGMMSKPETPAPPAAAQSVSIKSADEMPDLDEFSFFKW